MILPGLLGWLLSCPCRGRRVSSEALAQRVHQIDDVLAAGPLLRRDRFPGVFLIAEINQGRFVLVFEFVRLEVARLLIDDVPRKAVAGQKEMLMPIAGKKPAKEAKKPAAKPQRKSA